MVLPSTRLLQLLTFMLPHLRHPAHQPSLIKFSAWPHFSIFFIIPCPCLWRCLLSAPFASSLTPHPCFPLSSSQVILLQLSILAYHLPTSYVYRIYTSLSITFLFCTFTIFIIAYHFLASYALTDSYDSCIKTMFCTFSYKI